MSFRLKVASAMASKSVLQRELGRVAEMTTAELDSMVETHAPGTIGQLRSGDRAMEGDLVARRGAMADAQRRRVRALVDAIGEETTVQEGRRRMGPVGERLGEEARERLGVDETMGDLVAAARLLYQVLGIEFEAEEHWDGSVTLHIQRCGLSEGYDGVTCRLMSAADEGMIRGLNPAACMEFRHRITEGTSECLADIEFHQEGGR
jgi:hypothetical protein